MVGIFVRKKCASLVAATCSVAIAVSVLLTGCGGAARQQADVTPKAAVQVSSSICPSCSSVTTVAASTTVAPLPGSVVRVATYTLVQTEGSGATTFLDQSNHAIPQAKVIASFLALPKDSNKAIAINFSAGGSPVASSGGMRSNYISVGCLWMDVRWEYGYIPGCIKRNGWHLNFHLRNKCTNRELFNLHATAWQQNGPQFGLYESASGWCSQSRGTWTEIRGRFMAALSIVGVTGTAAYLISDAAAGLTVGAFAL